MKRILFVDDEPLLLEVIEARFSEHASNWEMDFASDGEEALQHMFRKPYDVVVADMRMPRMDGIELLTLVMQRYPNTTRIMLSGQADRDKNLRLVGTAHQYLSKPCDLDELEDSIRKALSQREVLPNESLKKLISQMQSLPSIPQLYLELVEELQKENPDVATISQVISRDMAMCSKLLQLVNSAFFGLPRRISNPEEAVGYLGVETIKALVLYLHIFSLYERVRIEHFSFDRLWNHCWSTGVVARHIARHEKLGMAETDSLFITGLLHDVGKLVLVTGMPSQYQEAINTHIEDHIPLNESEKARFGVSHAEVGAYLLGIWGLPGTVVDGVSGHHYPAHRNAQGMSPALITHVANALEHEMNPLPNNARSAPLDEAYLVDIGLSEKIEEWREVVMCLQMAEPA